MKSGSHFNFRKFTIAHDKSTHKVGTDGVLLGAWVNVQSANEILDIGTGSGLIALMLAQRTQDFVHIDGVEVQQAEAEQAMENVRSSPWPEKVKIYHTSIQEFNPGKQYDLIVSNPPFFVNSLPAPEARRTSARHTHSMPFEDLIHHSKRLLAPAGRLCVVLPNAEGLDFINLARLAGLFCTRKWAFRSRSHKEIERWLLEFSEKLSETEYRDVNLYGNGDEWSVEYRNLTGDFYLK